MKILDRAVYVGPNLYAQFRVIRMTVDLGALEQWPTVRLGNSFTDSLVAAVPGLAKHGCSYREEGGFLRRMTEDEGTWLGHVFEHVAIELQNMTGAHVTFGKTRSNDIPGQYNVVYEYEQRDVGLEAGHLALRLIHSLLPDEIRPDDADVLDFDFAEERDSLIRFAQRRAFGPSTASLVAEAEARDIPWQRLNNYSLVQFGQGIHSRRIQATITSETRQIAVDIASDKEETNRILGDLGLPVARQRMVYSAREAVRAAKRIGYPVVVKPLNANHGRGVSIHLSDDDAVEQAFHAAREHGRTILVESFIEGLDHRLLVVDGHLIAAAKRVPGHVVGDGSSTIEELVEVVNQDPRRGIGHEKVLTRLEFDYQAERLLQLKGLSRESVPGQGDIVYLRSTGNLSTGGTAVDVTDIVHPDNREMAERAARAISLDVAGVDFLTDDISESFKVTGGAICEVNAAPGFRMHVSPSEGESRNVAAPVIDMLFPSGAPSRVPVTSITGTNGKTTTARMVAHIFKMAGKTVGLASTDGVYIDGHPAVSGDMTGPASARMVLRDPKVEVAVLETARGGLLRSGLGYKWCNVGAVLNVQSDHLGLKGIESLDDLAKVKRIVAEVAKDTAVLNADDEHCLKMADFTVSDHLCYVTMDSQHALVTEHIQAGGRAVVLEDGMGGSMITIYDSGQHMPLLWSHMIPATLDGRALHNVQNAMFAAGIAFSMEVSLEEIRHGLRTFDTTFFQAPGRMNICDDHPFKVIMDYAHNPAAVSAMVDLAGRLEVKGQRIVVLAAPGDRRNEDILEIARLSAGHFDRYIVRRDDNLRGRDGDEVPMLLRKGLLDAGVSPDAIDTVPEEERAIDSALQMARRDDLVLLFADNLSRGWNQVTGHQTEEMPESESAMSSTTPSAPIRPAAFAMEEGQALIRDERGVRLARDEQSD